MSRIAAPDAITRKPRFALCRPVRVVVPFGRGGVAGESAFGNKHLEALANIQGKKSLLAQG